MKVTSAGALGQLSLLLRLGIGTRFGVFFPACIGDPFFPVSPIAWLFSTASSGMWGSQKRMKSSFPLFPYFTSVKKEKDLFWIFAFCFFCPFLMRARFLELDN